MRLVLLTSRNLKRRPLRTLLTVLGVASAMLLFVLVESLSAGLDAALSGSAAARTLIVYRQNRYCPQTSFLPERYQRLIADVPGVLSVLPVKVFLSNCRASLDIVVFQGAPPAELLKTRELELVSGDLARFEDQSDGALVGREFATRRRLAPGDRFRFGGIDVNVAGVFRSSEPVEEGMVLTHLEYLQRVGPVDRLGTVTQFEVKIDDPAHGQDIAREIDARLRTAEEPTDTRPKLAFLETATRDLREILRFGRWLALACVAVVLALVANTVLMSVQERVKEFGVFRTLGYRPSRVVALVLGEALLLGASGATLGLAAALVIIRTQHLSIGSEGVPVSFLLCGAVVARGALAALGAALLAAALPAWNAGRREIVASLRSA
ncbi:MAG: FtsX-like permease family protein [Planctomycetes bacterium]|nr:FtsX-like permease family protein [Planctomycetota bacterium]